MSKKTVLITCIVLLVGTLLTVGLLYQSDDSIADSYMAQYRKVTQDFQRTQVTTVKEFRDEDDNGTPGLGGGGITPGINPNPGGGSNGGTPPNGHSDATVEWTYPNLYSQKTGIYAGHKLGASSETVADKGCAVMSVLMMAEWKNGKTIDKNTVISALQNKDNFSGASVYWDKYLTSLGSSLRLDQRNVDITNSDSNGDGVADSAEALMSRLDNNQPTLIHYTGPCGYYNSTGHFCFLVGYKKESNQVTFYTADPSYGEASITIGELSNGNAEYLTFK